MNPTKICPTCHAEYIPEAQTCPDCNVTLEWSAQSVATDDDASPLGPATWDDIPDGEILGQLAGDNERVLKKYAALLEAAGIRSATLPLTAYVGRGMRRAPSVFYGVAFKAGKSEQVAVGDVVEGFQYQLFVPRDDYDRAHDIIGERFADLHPDQGMGSQREYDLGACPACSATLAEDAPECPDCGLVLG